MRMSARRAVSAENRWFINPVVCPPQCATSKTSSVRLSRGVMGPYSRPLRFDAKAGAINYLGEMT